VQEEERRRQAERELAALQLPQAHAEELARAAAERAADYRHELENQIAERREADRARKARTAAAPSLLHRRCRCRCHYAA
jgi:hypothetical protein